MTTYTLSCNPEKEFTFLIHRYPDDIAPHLFWNQSQTIVANSVLNYITDEPYQVEQLVPFYDLVEETNFIKKLPDIYEEMDLANSGWQRGQVTEHLSPGENLKLFQVNECDFLSTFVKYLTKIGKKQKILEVIPKDTKYFNIESKGEQDPPSEEELNVTSIITLGEIMFKKEQQWANLTEIPLEFLEPMKKVLQLYTVILSPVSPPHLDYSPFYQNEIQELCSSSDIMQHLCYNQIYAVPSSLNSIGYYMVTGLGQLANLLLIKSDALNNRITMLAQVQLENNPQFTAIIREGELRGD